MTRHHAFTDDVLADHDATALVALLQQRQVSAPELVEAAVARTERLDAVTGGLAHEAFDRARAEAQHPRAGFFSGVPTFVKDNVDVAGMPTQQGSDAYVARPAAADGDWARQYLATGLLPLGKTQLSEFGFSAAADHPRLGPVRSPWDTDRYAGASSAGAAAFVAGGAVPLAHANDGGGSIRIPASVNGLVGLKPTRGRTAQDRMVRRMPVRIVSDGVLTRTVRDTAAFFREAERVWRNPALPPVGDVTRPLDRPVRVAVVTRSVDRDSSPEVRDLTLATARRLENLGHRVEHLEQPPVPGYFVDQFVLYWSMLAMALVRTLPRHHPDTWDPERLDTLTRGLARHCERHLYRLPLATAVLAASRLPAARHHARYDVTLTPTVAHETPPVGALDPMQPYPEVMERLREWVAFTPLANATGEPAVSLPLTRTAAGLPQGMMLGAARGEERLLLELALQLEQDQPFARVTDP